MKTLQALAALGVLAAAPAAVAGTLRVPSQHATIQAAVDAADDGDTIVIAAGTYTEDVDIDGRSGLAIRGAGAAILGPGASITIHGNSTGILVRNLQFQNAGVSVLGGGEITLTRLTFTGGATAVGSGGVEGLVISRCTFRELSASALSEIDSTGYVVEKCLFEEIGDYAVILSPDNGFGTQGAVLSKNRLVNCGTGFALSGANAVVEKNRMEGLAGRGVETTGFLGTQGARISKNRIQTSGASAIGGAYNQFLVEKNILVGGGIQLTGAFHLLDRNRVSGTSGAGIAMSAQCTLTGNTVSGTGAAGITVQGDASVLERNTVADTDGSGIEVFADGCDVLRNTVSRADAHGFLVAGTGEYIQGNRAADNGIYDLTDYAAEGVNTYLDNRFGTTIFNYFD